MTSLIPTKLVMTSAALGLLVGLSGCADEKLSALLQQALDNQTASSSDSSDNQSVSSDSLTCSQASDRSGAENGRTGYHAGESRGHDDDDDWNRNDSDEDSHYGSGNGNSDSGSTASGSDDSYDGSGYADQSGSDNDSVGVADSGISDSNQQGPGHPPQEGPHDANDPHDPHDANDPHDDQLEHYGQGGSGDGCNGESGEQLTSLTGALQSHRFGEDCASCHTTTSTSEASEHPFTIAGSIYRNGSALLDSDAVVSFYTEPYGRGTQVLTLPVDAEGNFFTTQSVPELSQGLYPQVEHQGWVTSMVSQPTTTGSCASCHSSSTSQGPVYAQ